MKYAVITGSTKGIGKAIAEKILSNGYYAILNYAHDEKAAKETQEQFNGKFPEHFAICKADLSSLDGLYEYLEFIGQHTNTLDCLILNAGITDRSPFNDITPESWQRVMDTNLTVPLFLVQKLSSLLLVDANILFIGSLLGKLPHTMSLAYGVSKAALHFMAQCLVKDGNIIKNWKELYNLLDTGDFKNISGNTIKKYCRYNDGNSCKKLFKKLTVVL